MSNFWSLTATMTMTLIPSSSNDLVAATSVSLDQMTFCYLYVDQYVSIQGTESSMQ